jgi:chemotaxis regulatin CheY-phosphate phosphatase CheZ
MKTTSKGGKAAAKPAAKKPAAKKPVAVKKLVAAKKPAVAKKAATKSAAKKPASAKQPVQATGHVLSELKSLAKELNQAAKDLGKRSSGSPKEVSAILGNVERITADAATKSLLEAEAAKQLVVAAQATLSKDWSRRELEAALQGVSGHLTNIIVAQEFQDLAGQALRKAMKALVGAIIVVESGGPTEDQRLSQKDVDSLLKDLMP